jgi:predicted 2-oxoglutarate/Fe(II)-dependent dioxygenase YbiX
MSYPSSIGPEGQPRPQPLSEMLSVVVLQGWRDGLAARVENGPPSFRWRLADIDRALGNHEAAAAGYAACGHLGDSRGEWWAALMRGEAGAPPEWNDVPRPPPFLCLYDLLPTKDLADARAIIASRRVKLQNATIGDHALVDFDVRAAHSAGAGSALRALLLPRIFAAMSSENVLERLGLGPISRERVDVQLVCYPAGGKYRPHRDAAPGKGPHHWRRLTFIWYVHDEPKAFTGGDLLLHDDAAPDGANTAGWFTRFLPVRNMALLFPSNRLHEVTPVLSTPDDVLAGRLAVNVWLAADEDKGDPA